MSAAAIGNLAIFIALLYFLFRLQGKHVGFNKRVFIGLGFGVAFGAAMQWLYGAGSAPVAQTLEWLNVVGSGYVKLLQMIVFPLIMVSIVSAIIKFKDAGAVGKISALTLGVLVFTTMIAAGVGILMSDVFHLTAAGLTAGAAEVAQGGALQTKLQDMGQLSIASMLLDFIPANPFLDMTGGRKTSTIAIVIFSAIIGIAATGIARKKPQIFAEFERLVGVAHAIVMRIVALVLRLTPYGVLALMTKVVAGSNWADIVNLGSFVVASYCALAIMFGVHMLLVTLVGINPLRFMKKILPVLAFSFTSRSSAGAIPLNVQTQTRALGTPEGIANFAASFGATIGQNGCAGIYPAMVAVMIAPTVGVDPTSLSFILPLIGLITISSFGVAGVGGGATFAALIVLSTLNFPVALVGLLISIEPLIDMGRTALNVSGAITSGTVTSRVLGQTDMTVFESDEAITLEAEEKAE